jgi:hypothetical protein
MSDICFDKETFNIYLFLLVCIIVFLFYTSREHFSTVDLNSNLTKDQLLIKVTELQEQLQQISQDRFLELKSQQTESNYQNRFLEKIYNPLSGTSPMNPRGSFSTPPYDGFRQFQMLGYISGPNGRYPVMGRYRDGNRSNKFEYYTLDNERGRIKIPFKTKNYDELYDGDQVEILNFGNFTFSKYEDTDGNRYDPNVIY